MKIRCAILSRELYMLSICAGVENPNDEGVARRLDVRRKILGVSTRRVADIPAS
jgi:hypothetical protein